MRSSLYRIFTTGEQQFKNRKRLELKDGDFGRKCLDHRGRAFVRQNVLYNIQGNFYTEFYV